MGFALFRVSGRGLVITDEGQRLYQRSAAFFRELETLLGNKRKAARDVIRIGSFEVFTSYFMGPLVRDFFTGAELEIHELVPGRLEEALSLNKIDIGITYHPVARQGIEFAKVTSVRMGAFAKRGHFLNHSIESLPFAVPVNPLEGTPSGVKGLDSWPEEKYPRQARYRVDLMATGLALARQGLCAIFIPDFVARLHNLETPVEQQLIRLELPRALNSIVREVYVVTRESTLENQNVKRIGRALRTICAPDHLVTASKPK